MLVRDLRRTVETVGALNNTLMQLVEEGPRVLLVTRRGRIASVRSNYPATRVEFLELDGPEDDDPPKATTGRYPFEIDLD